MRVRIPEIWGLWLNRKLTASKTAREIEPSWCKDGSTSCLPLKEVLGEGKNRIALTKNAQWSRKRFQRRNDSFMRGEFWTTWLSRKELSSMKEDLRWKRELNGQGNRVTETFGGNTPEDEGRGVVSEKHWLEDRSIPSSG
jgi:hypothetical protein